MTPTGTPTGTAPAPAAAPTADPSRAGIVDEEGRFGDAFRRDHPVVWLLTLVGPFAATAAMLLVVLLAHGGEYARRLAATAAVTFLFFGRFVILGGTEGGGADPEFREVHAFLSRGELFAMVLWMDLATAVLLVFHAGFLFRMPLLGPRLAAVVEDGQFILSRQPWMRRATFAGLVAFVMFPLAATGSVGGAIFGRLLGLSRGAAILAIAIGSLLGCGLMYLGAGVVNRHLDRDNPWLTISGVAVVAGIIVLLNWRYRRMKRQAAASPGGG